MKKLILTTTFLTTFLSLAQLGTPISPNPILWDGTSTTNKWVLHTPATNNLIIAPRLSNNQDWDWSKITTFGTNGNVGIGVYPSTNEKLTINGSINVVNNAGVYPRIGFNVNDSFPINNVNIANYGMTLSKFETASGIGTTVSLSGYQGLNFYTNSSERMRIINSGKVNIGSIPLPTSSMYNNYKLFVQGGILINELKIVGLSTSGNWADYVFDENYCLKPLEEVETFININKHLPNIPSAAAIKEQGIDIGDMIRLQQEKIEELTLYIIEQNKLIDLNNKRLEALEIKFSNK